MIIAFLSALIATILGTAACIGIRNMKKRHQGIIMGVTNIPMLNAEIVTGISLMLLFISLGIKTGFLTVLLSHITFNIPYVITSVMPKLRQSSNMLYEAAMDLGCSPWKALMKVVIPDIMPGIISGFVLAFTLSLDDFVVSWFATDGIQNLSIYIYGIARRGISPKINALCTLMFIAVVTLLAFVNIRSIKEEREQEQAKKRLARRS